jgi:serine kinase of HPr protein (carbohydrate metabolism regulator)
MTSVTIHDIQKTLDCEVLHEGNSIPLKGVVASGLMSDVLTTEIEDFLLVCNLANAQVVRTAYMVGAPTILVTNGKQVPPDFLELCREHHINLLRTNYSLYEACVLLASIFPVKRREK